MPWTVLVLSVLIGALSLVPLGFVVAMTVATGWDTAVALIVRPRVLELLGNTIWLVLITVPLCLVIGVGGAWLVERTRLRAHRVWAVLLAAPLAIPAFVNAYAWVSVVPSMAGLGWGVFIATLSYYPLVYIPAAATLARLDPALEQSAASLGQGPWKVFFRVVLPQLRIAVTGGALLVGLHLLSEYGAFAMMRFDTFTTAIMQQYRSTFNGSAGNMLASVLVALCLVMLVVEARARGNARYAKLGSGAQAAPSRAPLGAWEVPAQAVLLGLAVIALGVPLAVIGRWLVDGGAQIWETADLASALGQSLWLGLLGAIATTAAAFPLSWLAVRYPGWLSKTLELANYVTSSMPGIVLALAFVTVALHALPSIYQTTPLLVIAYVLLFLPRALVSLRAGLAQAPKELEEAARALGRRPAAAFFRVTLRLAAPAAAGGAALVFLAVLNELTATLLLAPTGTSTLATQFWNLSSGIDYTGAAPYALLMILLSAPMTYLLFQQSKKAAGQ
ncbi:ABC transporter permease [Sinomonas susongensis]|uniref:ABC transporter permease n=1 Tax=Sinomonas susongensis TaxID=1324851 RepID=UPI001109ABF4|nr:iron ABC transporter permease [Sinomonas susongensis]